MICFIGYILYAIKKYLQSFKDATKISAAAFEHLAFIVENELDWPELSATTGFRKKLMFFNA